MRLRPVRDPRTIGLPGLEADVEVVEDLDGVPHVYAASEADALHAQGYLHARDRLFQMEIGRRLGQGRLAEVFGPPALPVDRHARVIGVARAARAEAEAIGAAERASVTAYARGVNAFLDSARLPLELRLLRVRVEPWKVEDSLLVGKVMALALGANLEAELARARLRDRLGAERAARVEPAYVGPTALRGPRLEEDVGAVLRQAEEARQLLGGGEGAGSNSWAVAPWRSRSGGALLANDPHLLLRLPPIWYVNHLDFEGRSVCGLSLPGAAGVVIGHNGHVAWGFTNAMADTQDLFEEEFHPDDPLRYRVPGGWATCELRREEIRVRGRRRPHVEEVRITHHGPVVTPPLGDGGGRALALAFTALEPGHIAAAVLGMNRARDADELDEAALAFSGPVQNLVYASRDGTIGYRLVGGPLPVRPRGLGLVPVDGASGEDDWQGFVPARELPAGRDPEEGLLVTANNRITDEGVGPFVTTEWLNGYRAQRIHDVLSRLERVSVEDCCRLQCDVRSLPGLHLQDIAARYRADDPYEVAALELLAGWDGELRADSPGGAVAEVLLQFVLREAHAEFGPELELLLGRSLGDAFAGMSFLNRALPVTLARLDRREDAWLPGARTWDEVFLTALARAARFLRERLGDDPTGWRWGDLHALVLDHPLALLPPLRRLFRRGPFPFPGDPDTVLAAWFAAWRGYGGDIGGPSARLVVDLGDPDASRFVLPGGQSGRPRSPRFDDQLADWLAGRTRPLRFSRAAVEAAVERRFLLVPG